MVTYDPHLGLFFRTTKQKCSQYHVQYFGISAIRGWVSVRSCVPLIDGKEKPFNEKGLTKKVKGEYEVAMQEVLEAAKLDYKQRKLKFIFSFGSPSKGGKKSKQKVKKEVVSATEKVLKVKAESRADTDGSLSNSLHKISVERNQSHGSRRKSSALTDSSETRNACSGDDADPLPNGDCDSVPSRRTSSRMREKDASAASSKQENPVSKHRAKVDKTLTLEKPKKSGVAKVSGLALLPDREVEGGDEAVPTPCLHSQHPSKPSTSSKKHSPLSSPGDCDQCFQYVNGSEGIEMKCTSKPEIFLDSSMETSVEPILMYVQKQYGNSNVLAPSKPSVPPPNLNRKALTRGVSTKNLPTKQSHRRSKASDRDGKDGGSPSLASLCLPPSSSSNGNLSSESGYETAKTATPPILSSTRKRKRTNSSSCSVSSLVLPPLALETRARGKGGEEMRTKEEEGGARVRGKGDEATRAERVKGGEDPPTRKRKRGRNSSSQMESGADEAGEESSTHEGDNSPSKRLRKANLKYTQPPLTSTSYSAQRSRRNSTALATATAATSDSTPSANAVGGSAHDSSSEVSTTSPSASAVMVTPPLSSSEESPSADSECENPVDEPATSRLLELSVKDKKRPKQESIASAVVTICSICDCEGDDLLMCNGHCMSSFHLDCLGLVEEPKFKFFCDECLLSSGTCFVCGKGHGELRKCSKPKCTKLYHRECIQHNKLFQISKSSFTCPLHVCAKCTSIGMPVVNHTNLLQCVKCPLALHKPDCIVAGCEVIDHAHMVCYQHVKITKSTKLYTHINFNTCLECGAIGSLFCCDVCSAAYHLECLDEGSRPASDTDHWKCPNCAVHDLPTYGSLVITKFGVWR